MRITSSVSAFCLVQSFSTEVVNYMVSERLSPRRLNGLLGGFWDRFVERV